MKRRTLMIAALAGAVLAHGAAAQDYTDEQLLELFGMQKQTYQEAEQLNLGGTRGLAGTELGGTRGVSLVTVNPDEVAVSEDVAVTGTGETVSSPTDPNEPLVLVSYRPEDQINLRIAFGFDSAALAPSELPKLEQMCRVMQKADVDVFRIIGHTDASGSEEYNRRLSILRAEEVARHLVEDCGIARERLQTMGRGEADLFDPTVPDSEENRRVEFQALS